ncbi:alpha-protein kinase 3 isoform X2 [Syngnathus scovelli]|uniref:alpha-protein kinase 3 isoform X2 n=1 Tax=Syngnathus scovelli TaxID=161590 RepID=UPI00210F32A7|nr:titin isoform X2 [Syngnathus scovelli]
MTSRRPMTRSFSANGRTSSFGEEESSSSNGRTESRNNYLSNVRPENRSTLCTVMAQLTEDVQPCFETTLKSKAVSENCNVKFTCVVSGYPAPELKWYKDDMEMDRYCGLPKYEIHKNGKTHTLHIYNCTLDDAAIYQVSASNSKGIVSCSGVLEVGTMSEFKIHQRFFSKLKQKAEKKRKDLEEQNKKGVRDNIPTEGPRVSPEAPPRKRPVPPAEPSQAVNESAFVAQLRSAANDVKEITSAITLDKSLEKDIPAPEELVAKKKLKITNGVDGGVNTAANGGNSSRGLTITNGGVNCYDGGISLAQFLSETHRQTPEEGDNPSQLENPQMDVCIENASIENEGRLEKLQVEKEEKEQDLVSEGEKEASHSTEHPKHHRKTLKDHEHHNVQSSLSSMLHTVKDFLFGKAKKDSHENIENKEKEHDHLPKPKSTQSQTPPSYRLSKKHRAEMDKAHTDQVVPMETDKPKEPPKSVDVNQPANKLSKAQENKVEAGKPTMIALGSPKEPSGQNNQEAAVLVENMEVSAGEKISRPGQQTPLSALQVLTEAEDKCLDTPVTLPQPNHPASSTKDDKPRFPHSQNFLPPSNFDNQAPPPGVISATVTSRLCVIPTEALQRGEINVEKMAKDKEVNKPFKKLCVENKVTLKDPPHQNINKPELAGLTPTLLEKGKPDKEVNYPPKKLCVETEEKFKELPQPSINKTKTAVLTPPLSEKGKPDKDANYPTKKFCVGTEVKSKEEPHADIKPKVAVITQPSPKVGRSDKDGNYRTKKLSVDTEEKYKEEPHPDTNKPKVAVITQPTQKVSKPHKEINNSSIPDKKLTHPPRPDILTPPLQEETVKIKAPNLISATESKSSQGDFSKQNTKSVSLTQEMKVESPKVVDLKMWSECTPAFAEENQSVLQSVRSQELEGERKEGLTDRKENQSNLKDQVPPIETNNKVSEIERKPLAVVNEPNKESVADKKDNKEAKLSLLEENSNMVPKDRTVKQQSLSEKVPLGSDVKEPRRTTEHIAVPRVEITEPQAKHFTLPLTMLALKKLESEPSILEKHLKPQAIGRDMIDSSGLLTNQKVLDHNKPSASDVVKDFEQLDGKTEIIVASVKGSQQINSATIPQINISCSDDKEDHKLQNTHIPDSPQSLELSNVPLFVVPPISVTCHENESELRKPVASEWRETETLVVTQAEKQLGTTAELREKTQGTSDQRLTENLSSLPNETAQQKKNDSNHPLSRTTEDNSSLEILKAKPLKQAKIDTSVTIEDFLRTKAPVERLTHKPPTHPSLSPGSIRKYMSKVAAELENDAGLTVPVITVDDRQSDKVDEDTSGGSTPTSLTPTSSLSCESSPRLKRRDSLSLIRSATPEELASGARRKIFIPKPKEDADAGVVALEGQKKDTPYLSPSQARRAALLQAPVGQNTPPMERRSPLMNRRKATLEVPKVVEDLPKQETTKTGKEEKVAEKKLDPLKAPQVIRKIRGEPFPDASGHLKLWCQFFNVLSDSTIKWFRDEVEILEVNRSAGDETQVALAIVLAASQDCGVYGCTIRNEYGTDTTDFLLSVDIMSDILLRDDLEVGEEIEMTPLVFTKGLANSGSWGDKYFGRIVTEMANLGEGCGHKPSRVKVIYGLNPVYESGSTCIIKVPNPIAYGTKQDNNLIERNLEMTKQECKIQNMIREYCKIFAAEARVIENFGPSLEVLPQYLMYRPANSVPYATVEVDLGEVFLKYCVMDAKGCLVTQSSSEMEQKCNTFQHWIHQWTHGNLLITRMEGVETKITNIRVATKTKGYQGLTDRSSSEILEQFPTVHQCNYYCGLLGLRPLKTQEQQQSSKVKVSRSPLLNRKLSIGSGSPQPHRKGHSPQTARKANVSPKVTRKVQETEDKESDGKLKPAETTDALEMR